MHNRYERKLSIIGGIILILLTVTILFYFQDLPFLWSLTVLSIVAAIGLLGYILGSLLANRKK